MGLYTAPSTQYSNINLNALASQYSAQFGHNVSELIQRITKAEIYDAAPQQFFDLKMMGSLTPRTVSSDEFEYSEMGYGRDAVIATGAAAAVVYPATQTFAVADTSVVSVDTIIVYPSNAKGNVTAIDTTLGTITVTPLTGLSLPAVTINDSFGNMSPVEGDAMDTISQYFRIEPIKRFNYVQMFVKAIRFGKMELYKLEKAGTYSNYMTMLRKRFYQQFRCDLSNAWWNGEKGEVTLANGNKAKTMGGLYPTMLAAGSPIISTTTANMDVALEDLALQTEYGDYGTTRFLYGTNRYILQLSKVYKSLLTRYSPDDEVAKLGLSSINIGSTNIVLVPYKRFEDRGSFPSSWEKMMFLVDHKAMTPVQCWGEESGDTLNRVNNGTRETYQDSWINVTFSCEFNNPPSCGILKVL
jgi:hypothetical protein